MFVAVGKNQALLAQAGKRNPLGVSQVQTRKVGFREIPIHALQGFHCAQQVSYHRVFLVQGTWHVAICSCNPVKQQATVGISCIEKKAHMVM
mmetsp:Transcript_16403/g.24057  ORF Transcript_16403/g.24057 Transcript_16403/m.24057 type:complete len:92 (-) Transcript_16403:193-468(-)